MKKNQICVAIAFCYTAFACAQQTYNFEGSTGLIVPRNVEQVELSYRQGEKRSENDCRKNIHFEKKQPTVSFPTKESGTTNYINEIPDSTYYGIKDAKISGQFLLVDLVTVGFHPEKVAMTYKKIREESFEGQPGVTAIATVILVGLPLLFSPKDTVQSAIGCTDVTDIQKYAKIDSSDKLTGKIVPREDKGTFQIKITGFGKETVFNVDYSGTTPAKINLGGLIASANLQSETEITVECMNCNPTNEDTLNKYGVSTNFIQLNADFRQIQPKVIQNERARIAEENRIKEQELRSRRAEEERVRRMEFAAQESRRKKEMEEQERSRQQVKNQQLQSM